MPLKKNKIIYNFTQEQLIWAKNTQARGEISAEGSVFMGHIYQQLINPQYQVPNCTSCGSAVASDFKRLVVLMEQSIGGQLKYWNPEVKNAGELAEALIKTAEGVKKEIDKLGEGQNKQWTPEDLAGMNKNAVKELVQKETGIDLGNVKSMNAQTVLQKALEVLNGVNEKE